jgi:hypothetical protein
MKKNLLNSLLLITFFVLLSPILIAFFYPIELEVRESTLWLHVLTMKANINIYDGKLVAYANQAHGVMDPIIKYLINLSFPFLQPWQVSRVFWILSYFLIFLINYLVFKNLKKKNLLTLTLTLITSIIFYSLFFLFTKTFQGRADITAFFFIILLSYFCIDRDFLYKNKAVIIAFLAAIILLTNWRFVILVACIITYPLAVNIKKIKVFKFYFFSRLIFLIFIFLSIPLFIFWVFFDLNLNRFINYFIKFFYFEGHFNLKHYINGLKSLWLVEKFFVLILFSILLFFILYKKKKFFIYKNKIKIFFFIVVVLFSIIQYLYNYVGGGIYYFTPVTIFLWFLFIDFIRNDTVEFYNIKLKFISSSLLIIFIIVITISSVKNSILTSIRLVKTFHEAKIANKYFSQLSDKNLVLSESLHFFKKKYNNEKIDIGDLLSYRAFQMGGDYQDTYQKHLSDISGLKYNYIINVFTDSSIIKDLVEKQLYHEIKIIEISGINLAKISILKKD